MYHTQRWTLDKIRQRLELITSFVYIKNAPLPPFRYKELDSPLVTPPVAPGFDDSHWAVLNPSDYWGTWMSDFILRTSFTVPDDWDRFAPIALYPPLGESGDFSHPEALAYVDGSPYAAYDRHHQEILLRPEWADRKAHTLALLGWTGIGGLGHGDFFTKLYMRGCSVVQIHQPTRDFIALARTARETAETLEEGAPARHGLLNALNEAFNVLETRDPLGAAFYASVELATAALKAGLEKAGASLDVTIHATGHAHLDVAWLWTLGETCRKSERTFFNVLRYMEQFPSYHFSQSQPQLYEFIRQDHLELYAAIRKRITEGRWEPMGGMWVEADCNLSGGESLARQFLLGRSYFRQHFGKDAETPVLWLPDVFGYAWALPQLIKQAGLDVAFPVDVLSPVATYEIQWGNVQRPTHKNTSWDWARFETCAQKWVDLSEGGYGVSLLNDCMYGHDIRDNVIRLTLLRSPTLPDPMADFGEHRFVYSLLPHSGSWQEGTQAEAYALNDPLISYQSSVNRGNRISDRCSLVTCFAPNVIIETVKCAEDGEGIIVRLYESHRKRGQATVQFAFAVEKAWVTNLLEDNDSALEVENDSMVINLKPYQITTVRVKGKLE